MTFASLCLTIAGCALILDSCEPQAQSLAIGPSWTTLDRVVPITVRGLKPKQIATIRALSRDRSQREWQAFVVLQADAAGKVHLGRQAPDSGSYTGVNPMGLFQAMDVAGDDRGRVRFDASWSDTVVTEIRLELEGRAVDSKTLRRTFTSPAVRAIHVHDGGLVGIRFTPDRLPLAHVLVLGGSEGGLGSAEVAAQLATHGFDALALAYFGTDSLPLQLARIPLEYFGRALQLFSADSGGTRAPVAILGTSKGAEAGLLIAVRYPIVSAVVAYAPSSLAWSCICDSTTYSSWTWKGEDVPAVPPGVDSLRRPPAGTPIRPEVNYAFRMRTNSPAAAVIPVEQTDAKVLLIAGGDDGLWPSAPMAAAIKHRRSTDRQSATIQALLYPAAGHLIGKSYLPAGSTFLNRGRIDTGGSPEANAFAQSESWPKVIEFLSRLSG